MGVKWEGGLLQIEPWPKDIGGQACKSRHKSFLRSVTNAKYSLLPSISLEEFLIRCLVLGHFPSGD